MVVLKTLKDYQLENRSLGCEETINISTFLLFWQTAFHGSQNVSNVLPYPAPDHAIVKNIKKIHGKTCVYSRWLRAATL